jgi:CBS domain containing-hemolysin-like protein
VGGIVVAFLLAFFSLAQTVTVSATTYDVDQLLDDRQRLEAQAVQIQSDLDRLGREPAIRKQAIDAGFGQLANPVVVAPR